MTGRPIPSLDDLTRPQMQGWACIWCGASLHTAQGGMSIGRAVDSTGYSVEVYACPIPYGCGPFRSGPAAPMNARGGAASPAGGWHSTRPGAGSLDRSGPGAGQQ
ncbi:hypothetical protein [Streptomyces sp. CL7]|uniref:hypothetical protein n=1 Tax=Streptomyces sp. CL7 TaxID=3096006 RepID=UPI002A75902A|nr:hypothetical protein [Streptomyces sp. CL7]WPP30055.1 hypothetical protein SJH97_12215 [Streptomyces sp. CL7]